jgi:hypothetical protein
VFFSLHFSSITEGSKMYTHFNVIPCRGGVEYLHRSPASRRRSQKGKFLIWDSKIWSRVPRKWLRWWGQAAIVNDRPVPSSDRLLYKGYGRRSSIEKNNSGRNSQGAGLQDELIGGKPPVVKQLWLWLQRTKYLLKYTLGNPNLIHIERDGCDTCWTGTSVLSAHH